MINKNRLVNYIRARRKSAGLSQRELASILGYRNEGAVSRHELFKSLPPLLMALEYEVIFQVPISELFPGLRETVELAIEKSLEAFEDDLRKQDGAGKARNSAVSTQKREWIRERRKTRCRSQ